MAALDTHSPQKNWDDKVCHQIAFLFAFWVQLTQLFYDLHGVWKSQKKVSFNNASEASKFTFWVDKSWLKMPIMVNFGEFLKTWSLRSNSITRQVTFNRIKIGEKRQKFKCDILSNFQTLWNFDLLDLTPRHTPAWVWPFAQHLGFLPWLWIYKSPQ